MSDAPAPAPDPAHARDVRGLAIAILAGVAIGAAHGIPRYGLFTMGTVAMTGLGVITVVSVYALVIALMPARNSGNGQG